MNKWNVFAPVYDLFLSKDRKAYDSVYKKIRAAVNGKEVLELATGTGLIAINVAPSAKSMVATDYAQKMIQKAKKKPRPGNLSFELADATNLSYKEQSFDVVIISNALHIMPEPEKALAEIRRVLKDDGLLIAPNFLWNYESKASVFFAHLLQAVGVKPKNKFTRETYEAFLQENGWSVRSMEILKASFPLAYAECVKSQSRHLQEAQ